MTFLLYFPIQTASTRYAMIHII